MISFANRLGARLDILATPVLTSLARFVFAAVLLLYFWSAGVTKLGDGLAGLIEPSLGAYAQIFPKAMEAVSYDVTQLSEFHRAVVLAGTWAEFILPALLVLGLFTRLAALGMIVFVIVQSITDLFGHGAIAQPETVGAWFDRISDSVILDQRAFWMLLFALLLLKGGGPLSLDRLFFGRDPR
ncbi:MAG: DoxX family protein [Pseudomonadota bacterium]